MEVVESYPLSPLQQGMLYHSLYAPLGGVYIEQLVFEVAGGLDLPAWERAWRQLGERHAVLRTRFRWDDGEVAPVQEVVAAVDIPFAVYREPDAPRAERDARLAAFLEADRTRGFGRLSDAPLWRVTCCAGNDNAAATVVWTFHHALLDGRSLPGLISELGTYYVAATKNKEPDFGDAPPPRPFRAFIEWLEARNEGASEAFWRDTLRGFQAPTPLGVTGLGDTHGEMGHAVQAAILSPALTDALRALAQTHGVTLNTVVQGAWAILLSRYSGETDVVWGATRAGRAGTVDGANEIVGPLINTLPVRATANPERALGEFLRDLRAQHIAVRPHEHTPLTRVQGWSAVPRSAPLFDSLVVFENYELGAALAGAAGTMFTDFELREQTNFALTLAAYAGAESLRLKVDYDRARFSGATATRLLGHLETLLSGMAAGGPDAVLGDLPLVAPPERAELLALSAPENAAQFPNARCLHHRFEERAEETPHAVALSYENERLTYAELNVRANRLAHRLRRLGVGPETLVGLLAERSIELVVGLLAILKAGGAYLPIDPAYPDARIAFMLGDARAPVLLAQKSPGRDLPAGEGAAHIVYLDDGFADESSENPAREVGPDNAAYVIYTSGSTGNPKGVMVTHRNVDRLFQATEADFAFGPSDIWTLFHSHAFDFSVWEIWGALLYGGRLVVVPYLVSRSPDDFHALLRREHVTVLNQTPSAFRTLMEADAAARSIGTNDQGDGDLALRLVIFGGEALDIPSLAPWWARHGDQTPRLVNMYGITETTVHVTYRPLVASDAENGNKSVIGVPLRDLRVYVLDGRREPVPVGVAGEMYVGGAGLARGYLNRPELTSERFIPDPFREEPGARLYRTGDLARRLPNGDTEYLGRADQQVKLRGFRIELGEIEAALGLVPGVRASVVVVHNGGESGGEAARLVAYVAGNALPVAELRRRLQKSLPPYMIPAAFVFLPALPLTANGKIDKNALLASTPFIAAPAEAQTGGAALLGDMGQEAASPPPSLEAALAVIWQSVLLLDRVGGSDNVFELGAHSLLLVAVHSRIRAVLGREVPIVKLFQYPTINMLAQHLREEMGEGTTLPSHGAAGTPTAAQDRARRQREALIRQKQQRTR